jgi:ATP/maltotriose-dependent transcriptional regulator MalT
VAQPILWSGGIEAPISVGPPGDRGPARLGGSLLASPSVPVTCLAAPPGHGKTTLPAKWSERKAPRAAWVSVDRRDNDPVVLLSYIATALARVEPVDPGLFSVLAAPGVSVAATVVPRLPAAVAAMTEPVALVLNHMEVLQNRACLDAVAELALGLPAGSQVVLAARPIPALPVALLRAQGQVVEVGTAELAMDEREGQALLERAGSCRSWRTRTCCWSPWTAAATGTATTSCSGSCSWPSCSGRSRSWSPSCTPGRRRGMWRTGRRRRRSTLTTAELRLLPLAATHLTLAEIGQRLYVSKHTVKTQAISIYRKLGASSRSQVVQRLQEIGLRGV